MRLYRALGAVLLFALPAFAEEESEVSRWIKVFTRESGQGPALEIVLQDGTQQTLPVAADTGPIRYLPEGAFGRRPNFGLDEHGWNAGLIRFDLSGLEGIKSAHLVLYWKQSGIPIRKPLRVGLSRLAGPFDEYATTWETVAAFAARPAATLVFKPGGSLLRVDVSAEVKALLKRGTFHGWILQSLKQKKLPDHMVVRPGKRPGKRPAAKPRAMARRKGDRLLREILDLAEWQPDAAAAVAQAKADKKLALALVRASFNETAPNDNEEIFLATILAHPGVHPLVREHFVPTRVFYPGWTYTYGTVREPDPLKAMGTSAAKVKPFALVVADGEGKHLGTFDGIGTFDPYCVQHFLWDCTKGRSKRPWHPAKAPTPDGQYAYADGVKAHVAGDIKAARAVWKTLRERGPWRHLVQAWEAWPERMRMYSTAWHLPLQVRVKEQALGAWHQERAEKYLLHMQTADGSWPTAQAYAANIPGVTALCGRALHMRPSRASAAGVARARDWCLRWMRITDPEEANSFGTTYVLDFFVDLYAADPAFRKHAQAAVRFHERGQAPNGGWGYSRKFAVGWRGGFGGWPVTDKGRVHSMNTGPALVALVRAKKAGLKVSDEVLERGTKALLAMKDGPAVFTYTYPVPRNFNKLETSIGRSCCCEHALVELGAAKEKDLEHAVATFLERRQGLRKAAKVSPGWMPPHAVSSYFQFFAYHHAARAIRRLPEAQRAERLTRLRDDLLACVEPDGTWVDYLGVGKPYGTAMALMILAWAPLK